MNTELGVYLAKQMNAVKHDFQFNDFAACFVSDFMAIDFSRSAMSAVNTFLR